MGATWAQWRAAVEPLTAPGGETTAPCRPTLPAGRMRGEGPSGCELRAERLRGWETGTCGDAEASHPNPGSRSRAAPGGVCRPQYIRGGQHTRIAPSDGRPLIEAATVPQVGNGRAATTRQPALAVIAPDRDPGARRSREQRLWRPGRIRLPGRPRRRLKRAHISLRPRQPPPAARRPLP